MREQSNPVTDVEVSRAIIRRILAGDVDASIWWLKNWKVAQ